MMLSWIGWIATACFGLSYFCRRPSTLRLVQAGAALLWIIYGAIIHALPVVVANVIVAMAALYSAVRGGASMAAPARSCKPEIAADKEALQLAHVSRTTTAARVVGQPIA